MATFTVNVGINYPPNDKRAEPGDTVDGSDLPSRSLKWLTEQGIITPVGAAAPSDTPAGA